MLITLCLLSFSLCDCDIVNSMEVMKRNELLKQHQYEIWQSKDGKWYTYLPVQGGGRVLKRENVNWT